MTGLFCLLAMAGVAQAATATGFSVSGDGNATTITALLDDAVGYSATVLPDPYRVVIDVPDLKFDLPPGAGRKVQGLVKAIRYGIVEKGKSRIVIDTSGPVLITGSKLVPASGDAGPKILVKLMSIPDDVFRAAFARDTQQSQETAVAEALPAKPVEKPEKKVVQSKALALGDIVGSISPVAGTAKKPAPKVSVTIDAPEETPVAAPVVDTTPKVPRRKLVVIDPGHGGQDPGALSPNNTLEKDITLAVAKALRDVITASGDIDVKLTHEDDKFVSLEDRSAFARANKADLFIAIHADTVHGTSVSGTTIYTLSDKGSDEEAEALAQKENRSDEVAGIALTSQKQDIANLLINLAQRDSRNQAALFAKTLLANLRDVTRMTGKPVRSAGFTVLKSPDVPSVLVELGYLSNVADEERMKSPAWQKLMARSMATAVQRFLVPAAVAQR